MPGRRLPLHSLTFVLRAVAVPVACAVAAIGARVAIAQPPARNAPAIRSAACEPSLPECSPPPVPREFRGVWVATVANMDWPSRAGLPADSARLELIAILDQAVRTGLNAIVLQIRPAGDALYASRIEPWSEYLTGRQGQAPAPAWDPLAFAVREAHARGLELHAWFNPYRARDPSAKGPLAATHLSRQYPRYAKRYGQFLWFDPGEPNVRRRTVRVVLDVVRRYDIDGVHFDDYFYPYPIQRRGRGVPFPDETSFQRYRRAGGTLARDDWRRDNVNRLVDTLRREIARAKPWVKFGISPFGIWRPGEPATVRGFDAFDGIYADARLWLQRGWVDYLVPQLYWGVEQDGQRFGELLRWWVAQNDSARHIWPGLAGYKIGGGRAGWRSKELLRQVDTTRAVPGDPGAVIFPMRAVLEDRDTLATRLAEGPYATRALVPAMPWKGDKTPRTPAIAVAEGRQGDVLTIARRPGDNPRWYVVQALTGGRWHTSVLDGTNTSWPVSRLVPAHAAPPSVVSLLPVSRTGIAGSVTSIRMQ